MPMASQKLLGKDETIGSLLPAVANVNSKTLSASKTLSG